MSMLRQLTARKSAPYWFAGRCNRLWSRQGDGEPLSAKQVIKVTVNGRIYERLVEVRMTLADFIRQDLDLTGTHLGCEHGVCGACTVAVDGAAVRSCLLFAAQMDGHAIE